MNPLLTSAGGVTLIGGGRVNPADLDWARGIAPLLVAADGGGDTALDFGLLPDAVIGDLDSLSEAARAAIPPRHVHRVAEQDSTDFAKCLRLVEAPFFIALGFTGRRVDHTLAALSVLVQEPRPVLMLGSEDAIFRAPPELALDLTPGLRVSIYPMGPVRGRSQGLHWPTDGIEMSPAGRVGTSNRADGPVRLWLDGPALILLPHEARALALSAIAAVPPQDDPGRG